MANLKFSCPQCQQHIECDQGYAGMEIGCPTCNSRMVVPGAAPEAAVGVACPGCGVALAPDAKLCTQCGFNLATGQKLQIQMQTESAPRPKPGAYTPPAPVQPASRRAPSEGMNPSIVAGVILAIFVVLYFIARSSQQMALVFLGVQALFSLGVTITVIVKAFQEGAGTGFMTMCIPFYIFFFVYGKSESPLLKALFSVAIITRVAAFTLKLEGLEGLE